MLLIFYRHQNQDGRVVKALDLRSNGHEPTWVRTPLLVGYKALICTAVFGSQDPGLHIHTGVSTYFA